VLYSLATQRFSRGTVFNIVMSAFLAFMAAFGLLYPSHEALHFSTLAGKATGYLPSGTPLPFHKFQPLNCLELKMAFKTQAQCLFPCCPTDRRPASARVGSGGGRRPISILVAAGFAGLVGMVRNWMFTLFYCSAELWGDVVLSLLFWGLANEMTTIEEAPGLYPLFGVGANVPPTHSPYPPL
jgi:ATP/ADP translocase